ncbi:TonB-dependent receptor domain-containing protein [Rhodoferax sp. BAB1]|uniref:TonB-dependent receptor domain-containing protein n=1 Tax=Rhodoferax sp. BAB1 TaxID=2741720 RepID=UPI001575FDB7|nr:TonB-dependent receptor [Rhodoferax sp. BAB1]QKO21665.1 TonB-dependent receptor [Rhodoferax sp. BAB1]
MKIRLQPTRLAVLSCLAVLHLPSPAQTVAQLGVTVVTAARVEQPLAEVLPSVSVITREDIDRAQAASLADLLQGEAGFEFGRNGGPGNVTSFFLRGAASTNLVIMIDGVRTLVDGWGNLSAIDLPLSQIERIELLRGNASALYGEAAVGGVIQIFTREVGDQPGAYGTVTAGSRGSRGLTAGYAARDGDLGLRLDAGAEHTDGFSAMNPAQNTRVNPDRDAIDRQHFSGKLTQQVSRDLTLGVYANVVRTKVDFDDGSSPAVATDVQQLQRETALLNVYAEGRLSPDWRSRIDLSRTTLTLLDELNGQPNQGAYTAGRSTGQQNALRWFNSYAQGADRVFNFGVESGDEAYTSDATSSGYRAQRRMFGAFAGVNQTFGALSLQGNLRMDSVEVNKLDTIYARRWEATSGLLGLGWRLSDAWRLTGSVSTGFRAPSAGELSNNIDLKPETHRSSEAGVAWARGTDSLRLVAFQTRTDDAIYWQSVSPWTPVNIGKVRNSGVELSGRALWLGNQIRYALVSQDPWNESDGTRLARRARDYGSLEVSRLIGATTAGMRFNAFGDRYDSGAPGRTLAGYATVALYASRPLSRDWTVRVKAENLFDRTYQLAYGYNTPPSGVWVTLAYQQH